MLIDLNTIEFLNTEQLAELFGLSKTSIYRLISHRLIPFYKLGHVIRFKRSDILEYLEKNCIESITK